MSSSCISASKEGKSSKPSSKSTQRYESKPAAILLTGVDKLFTTVDIYTLLEDFGKFYRISSYYDNQYFVKYVVYFEDENDAKVVKQEMDNYQLGCGKLKINIVFAGNKNALHHAVKQSWGLTEISRKLFH